MSEEKSTVDIRTEKNKLQNYLDKLNEMNKRIEKQNNARIVLDENNNTSEKFEYDIIDDMIVTINKEISELKEKISQEYQIKSEDVNENFLQDKIEKLQGEIKELRKSKRKRVTPLNNNGGKSRRRSRKNKRTRKSKKKARRSKKARKTRK